MKLRRRTIGWGLTIYWIVTWSAVVFQIDRFPLSWVPMYSRYRPSDQIEVRGADREATKRGLRVTQQDGTVAWVTRADLNIAKRHFRRLYRQRLFGQNPADQWPYRVLRSLNRTLGRSPGDPDFIVKVESEAEFWWARKSDLEVEKRVLRRSDHEWRPDYDERWKREGS